MICKGAPSVFLACAGASPAEPSRGVRLPKWFVRAQDRLALDRGQQRKLRALLEENTAGLRALQTRLAADHGPATLRGLRGELAVLQREFREGLEQILRPEQVAEWDALLDELLDDVHLRNAPRLAETLH